MSIPANDTTPLWPSINNSSVFPACLAEKGGARSYPPFLVVWWRQSSPVSRSPRTRPPAGVTSISGARSPVAEAAVRKATLSRWAAAASASERTRRTAALRLSSSTLAAERCSSRSGSASETAGYRLATAALTARYQSAGGGGGGGGSSASSTPAGPDRRRSAQRRRNPRSHRRTSSLLQPCDPERETRSNTLSIKH